MSVINSMIRRRGTVERSRREKESMNEFSLYNTKYFKDIENSNISVKGYNWNAIDLLLPYEKGTHIPKEVGEELERLINSDDVIGMHRTYTGLSFNNHEGDLLDNETIMGIVDEGIYATGQSGYGGIEEKPSPSTNFHAFSGLSGWLNFVGSYKNNDVIYLYRFPRGTVTKDMELIDTENKSGLYTVVNNQLTYSKDNIIKVITKDSNGYFRMYDPEVLRKQYEERSKQL